MEPSGARGALTKSLSSFMAGSTDIAKKLVDAISQESSPVLAATVASLIKHGELDVAQLEKLQLVENIGRHANWDELLLGHVLSKPGIESLADVVLRYYHDESLPAADIKNLEQFRLAVWREEPVAVLLSAVLAEKMLQGHELREATIMILQAAVKNKLPLISAELRSIVFEPHFFAKLQSAEDIDTTEAYEVAKACQRLHMVVSRSEDVDKLLDNRIRSAHDIALLGKATFVNAMTSSEMDTASASRLHNHATSIDCQNQETWIRLLEQLKEDYREAKPATLTKDTVSNTAGVSENQGSKTTSILPSGPAPIDRWSPAESANLTEIFDLQSTSCDDCCSVIGPSAYFVDLLKFLDLSLLEGKNAKFKSALGVIAERRPDLLDLELSCANSKDMVQYITIVNEVLEAFICAENSRQSKSTTKARVAGDFTADSDRNTDTTSQLFPLSTFPFDPAADASERYLATFGFSRNDMLQVFHSEVNVLNKLGVRLPGDVNAKVMLSKEVDSIFQRALTCTTLGLQAKDLSVITRENIFPYSFFTLVSGLGLTDDEEFISGGWIPPASACWGYVSTGDMLNTDEKKKIGLGFIQSQFMARSGLTAKDVIDLASSLWFNRQLVITNDTGTRKFNGQLSQMRLRMLNRDLLIASGEDDVAEQELETDDEKTPQDEKMILPLSEGMCHRLQSFVRLRQRLGWSIRDLDAVLSALASNQIVNGVVLAADGANSITCSLLRALSQVVAFSKLVDRPAPSLLPLWAFIDTHGPDSYYERVFLGPASKLSGDDIFEPDEDTGKYFVNEDAVENHLPALQAALKRTPEELNYLLEASGITNTAEPATLNLGVLSTITRHSLMAALLNAKPADYLALVKKLPRAMDIFQDPETTLELVRQWKQLTGNGWSNDDILSSLQLDAPTPSTATLRSAISLAASAYEQVTALQTKWLPPNRKSPLTQRDMMDLCIQLFDIDMAKRVVEYVQGSQVTTSIAKTSEIDLGRLAALVLPTHLSITEDPVGHIIHFSLYGVLNDDHLKSLETQAGDCGELLRILKNLAADSLSARTSIAYRLCRTLTAEKQAELLDRFDALIVMPEAGMAAEDVQLLTEKFVDERRMAFATLAAPALHEQCVQEVLAKVVAPFATKLEPSLMPHLLSVPLIKSPTGNASALKSSAKAISGIDLLGRIKVTRRTQAYFCPKATNSYQFIFGMEKSPSFSVNGVALSMQQTSLGWQSAAISMTTGETYLLAASSDLFEASWTTAQQPRPTKLVFGNMFPVQTINTVASILEAAKSLMRLVTRLDLGLEDFKYLTSAGSSVPLSLPNVQLKDLQMLDSYRAMRDTVTKETGSLARTLRWLRDPSSSDNVAKLCTELAKGFVWSKEQIAMVIDAKYPDLPPSEIYKKFQDFRELLSMQDILGIAQRLDGSTDRPLTQPVLMLFDLAVPRPPHLHEAEAAAASALQLCLTPTQLKEINKSIAERKRTVLVQLLLQQEYVKNLGIESEDGLFSYFMIDVQMGVQLETTRMKQAISTVQIFVQRCLLGLEAESGIPSKIISQSKWAWMQRHNTWQATRRAFLYPENWLEPSLRDDKTPLFDEFETAIMHKDLSWNSFVDAIRSYAQGLGAIADLRVDAYLREHRPGSAEIYHFFGRSRHAPFEFFYRSMSITRPESFVSWTPWRKIEVDITTHDADWDGTSIPEGGSYLIPVHRNGRLFLFLPQIFVKTETPGNQTVQKVNPSTKEKETVKASLYEMAQSPPPMQQGPSRYEIRMGWTELANGSWTPKRLSDTFLSVPWNPQEPEHGLPPLAQFVFESKVNEAGVVINVGYWASEKSFCELGRFDINNNRIACLAYPGRSPVTLQAKGLVTAFHKYSWSAAKPPDSKVLVPPAKGYRDGNSDAPLLAIQHRDYAMDLSWTLSFSDDALATSSGLVVDEKKSSSDGTSVFMYPRQEYPASQPDALKVQRPLTSADFHNSAVTEVIEHEQAQGLVEAALRPDDAGLQGLLSSMDTIPERDYGKAVIQEGMSKYHELATSYAVYNWELGLHAMLMAVDRFHTTQQFELALKAARLVFDPTASSASTEPDVARAACWKFKPFRDLAADRTSIIDKATAWPEDNKVDAAVTERKAHPSITHASARGRPQAYMKWVIMKYIQILCDAGDAYFRQGSFETLPLAIQRYMEADHVLGPAPPKVPKLGKPVIRSWKTLTEEVNLELSFPFLCDITKRGSDNVADTATDQSSILGYLRTNYFCLPANPQYEALRTLVQDRLWKARNNLDINGRPIVYSMMEPYIDPGQMARALQSGAAGAVSSLISDRDSPMPYQRFSYLVGKALELCNELRAMGDQFLQAKEKQDSEALSCLKARQDTVRQKMQMELKALQRDEITKTIESLQLTRSSTVSQLQYYLSLIGEPHSRVPRADDEWEDLTQTILEPITDSLRMSPFEMAEMTYSAAATGMNVVAGSMEAIIGMLRAIPNVTTNMQPMGCGVSVKADAGNVAEGSQGVVMALKLAAMVSSELGSQAARAGNLTKQLQERRLQANIRGREIKNIDKQIEIQLKRLDMNQTEQKVQSEEIDNAVETELWYRSKYTNENLYMWFEKSLRSIHFDLYNLTADLCRQAERAARFEKGPALLPSTSQTGGHWDSSRDGLLAAQEMQLNLRRLESAYLLKPAYDFELTKNVSLRQLDPLALISLRETATATFSLPETLFDLDFPGHYMRRLRSVSVSIPCIVGPYTTVAATLTLTEHRYRVSAAASSAETYAAGNIADGSFRNDSIPISQVAISSGMQDSGTFELNFRQDSAQFQPFEGAGAVSSWRLELPAKSIRQFNYDTISDVVLHLRYTAVSGGPILKRAAFEALAAAQTKAQQLMASEGLWGYLEVKNDLANQWHSFRSALRASDRERRAEVDLQDIMVSRLPLWCQGKSVLIESMWIVIGGDVTKDKLFSRGISVPALGKRALGQKDIGSKKMLSREGANIALGDEGWKLVVERAKGEVCGIEDIYIFFRYVLEGSPA